MEYLNSKQAAEYLCVTDGSLRSMRSVGCGPPYRHDGRSVRYSIDDLDAYVSNLDNAAKARRANRLARQKKRGTLADRRGCP